jgi:hypothetical protein
MVSWGLPEMSMKFAVDLKLAIGVYIFGGSVTIFVAVYEPRFPYEFFGCTSLGFTLFDATTFRTAAAA